MPKCPYCGSNFVRLWERTELTEIYYCFDCGRFSEFKPPIPTIPSSPTAKVALQKARELFNRGVPAIARDELKRAGFSKREIDILFQRWKAIGEEAEKRFGEAIERWEKEISPRKPWRKPTWGMVGKVATGLLTASVGAGLLGILSLGRRIGWRSVYEAVGEILLFLGIFLLAFTGFSPVAIALAVFGIILTGMYAGFMTIIAAVPIVILVWMLWFGPILELSIGALFGPFILLFGIALAYGITTWESKEIREKLRKAQEAIKEKWRKERDEGRLVKDVEKIMQKILKPPSEKKGEK